MSTYNCFIRKNNKYLRKKLRDLGYLDNTCFTSFDNFLYTLGGDYYTCKSYDKFSNMRSEEFVNECIDCGTNEELFLAIAALRDDSNRFQWFTDGNRWSFYDLPKQADWLIDESQHKATIEELIEHFKMK